MRDPIIIQSNAECMRILTEIGIVDKLQPIPPYTRAHTFFEYMDAHCVATYDKGHANEADNGFQIVMIPYAMMPKQEAHELLEDVLRMSALGPGGEMRYVERGGHLQ